MNLLNLICLQNLISFFCQVVRKLFKLIFLEMSSILEPCPEKILKFVEFECVDFLDVLSEHRIRFDIFDSFYRVAIIAYKLGSNPVVDSLFREALARAWIYINLFCQILVSVQTSVDYLGKKSLDFRRQHVLPRLQPNFFKTIIVQELV